MGRRVGFFARPARRTISIKSATSASNSALTSGTASSRPASLWCAGNRVTVLGWVGTLLCIGTALGTFARNLGELSAIQDVGGLALTGLGGALVPLAVLPAWVHHVAEFSPGYWGVHSMRWALDGNAGGVLFAEFVLGCFAIAAIAAAAWRIRRGWQRGQVM